VRLQPNSLLKGSMKRLNDDGTTERSEKPEKAARTTVP
jgi:hypothetical protein